MNLSEYHNLLYSGTHTRVFDRYAAEAIEEGLQTGIILRETIVPTAGSEIPPAVKIQWLVDLYEISVEYMEEYGLQSETFLVGGVMWHLHLRIDLDLEEARHGAAAVLELHATLAPTHWGAAERVRVSGALLAPLVRYPAKMKKKGHSKRSLQDATGHGQGFNLALSAKRPVARLGLISDEQVQRFAEAGEIDLQFEIRDVSAAWEYRPTHIEAAYCSAAELHGIAATMAASLGVRDAMSTVWPAIIHNPDTGEVGLRYLRDNLAVDSAVQMVYALVLDNLLCHFKGDRERVETWVRAVVGVLRADLRPSPYLLETAAGTDASYLLTPCPGWSWGPFILSKPGIDWLTPPPPSAFVPGHELSDKGSDAVGVASKAGGAAASGGAICAAADSRCGRDSPDGDGEQDTRQMEGEPRGHVEAGPGGPGVRAIKGHPEVPDFIAERGASDASERIGSVMAQDTAAGAVVATAAAGTAGGGGGGGGGGRSDDNAPHSGPRSAGDGGDGKQQQEEETQKPAAKGVVDLALSVIRALLAWGILMAVGFAATVPALLLLQARSAASSSSSCSGADAAAEEAPSDGAGLDSEPHAAETEVTVVAEAETAPGPEAMPASAADSESLPAAVGTAAGSETQAAAASAVEAVQVEAERPAAAAAVPGATSTPAKSASGSRSRRSAKAARRAAGSGGSSRDATAVPLNSSAATIGAAPTASRAASNQAPATRAAPGQPPAARAPTAPAGPHRRVAGSGASNRGTATQSNPAPAAGPAASGAAPAAGAVGSADPAASSSTNSSVADVPALESTVDAGPAAAAAAATSVPPARIDPRPVTVASFIAAAATATVAALGRMVMLGRALDRTPAAAAVTEADTPASAPGTSAMDQDQEQQQQQQSGDQQEEAPPPRLSLRQRLALLDGGSSPRRAGPAAAAPSVSLSSPGAVASAAAPTAAAATPIPDPADSADSRLCLVCLDEPRQVGFLHGGSVHFGVCGGCAELMRQRPDVLCPVCRGPVERLVEIFG